MLKFSKFNNNLNAKIYSVPVCLELGQIEVAPWFWDSILQFLQPVYWPPQELQFHS